MNSLVLILLVTLSHSVFSANQNPGHLQPLGSVGSLIHIDELNQQFPTVSKLFTYYIPKLEPILSRQVLNEDPHYPIWQTDDELVNQVYGLAETDILVESFQSKQRQRVQMTFQDFLQRYGKEPLLFADQVPTILQKYLVVPKPLQCEVILDTLESAIILMNGMNASPLLFHEEYDHFHCVLRGKKHFVLINTLKYPNVRKIIVPEKRNQRLPLVNPDRVDLDQFPALADIDYHLANLTSGDCLFIPSGWIFQERSLENTISVIYNIKHQLALDVHVRELKTCAEYDPTFTLDQIDWPVDHGSASFKDLIIDLVKTKAEGFDKWQENFSKHLKYDLTLDEEASAVFEEFYNIIDVNADGLVSTAELEQIAGEHERHLSDALYELTKVIAKNRKDSAPKAEEQLPETVEDEEQNDDEQLRLENYKTDL